MSPKKLKRSVPNAFYFFMLDCQKNMPELKNKSLSEISQRVGNIWKNLPTDRRAYFDRRAKEAKLKEREVGERYSTTGVPLSEKEAEAQAARERLQRMEKYIQNVVRTTAKDVLLKKKFYFIDVNYYCKTEEMDVIPCEISLVEFTLQNGEGKSWHWFVGVETIPTGYGFHAKSHSESTHGIPMPIFEEAESDFTKIIGIMEDAVIQGSSGSFGETLPVVYCLEDNIPDVEGSLRYMSAMTKYENKEIFRVYDIQKLFFELNNATAPDDESKFQLEVIVQWLGNTSTYDYVDEIGCKWHQKRDLQLHCSLTKVRRWVYIISDRTCRNLGITMIPARHCPKNTVMESDSFRFVGHKPQGRQQSSQVVTQPETYSRTQERSQGTGKGTAAARAISRDPRNQSSQKQGEWQSVSQPKRTAPRDDGRVSSSTSYYERPTSSASSYGAAPQSQFRGWETSSSTSFSDSVKSSGYVAGASSVTSFGRGSREPVLTDEDFPALGGNANMPVGRSSGVSSTFSSSGVSIGRGVSRYLFSPSHVGRTQSDESHGPVKDDWQMEQYDDDDLDFDTESSASSIGRGHSFGDRK